MDQSDAAPAPTPAEPAPAITRIADFNQLLSVTRAPKPVVLQLGMSKVEIEVRALTETEWAEVQKIGADLRPPPKFKDPLTKKQPDGFDEEDPEYVRAATAAFELKRTLALSMGLVGLEMPGANLEQKNAWRRDNLPPQVVDALFAAIRALTADPASLAYFTSPAS